jgi:hypothetical protein
MIASRRHEPRASSQGCRRRFAVSIDARPRLIRDTVARERVSDFRRASTVATRNIDLALKDRQRFFS